VEVEEEQLYNHFKELVLNEVDKGIEGRNAGIPLPLKRLEQVVNGIQQQLYYLIGGQSGSGKTALVDFIYVLAPYLWVQQQELLPNGSKIKFKVIYRSMERSKKYKLQKWTCVYLYLKHGLTIDVPTINGWASKLFEITPEIRSKIESAEKFINGMLDSGIIEVHDGAENPTGIMKDVFKYAHKVGVLKEIQKTSKEGNTYTEKTYTPNDPNLYTIIIEDHLGKLKLERGFTLKQTIDKMSEYNGLFRDIFGFSVVAISQFNRSLADSTRMRNKTLAPEPSDFKDTGNTYEDADLVIGLFNPFKLKISDDCGYIVDNFVSTKGYNRYRSLHVLKNSFGIDDISIGLLFRGEMGIWTELPKPEQKADLEKIYRQL
tara:strand:+ start:8157 stop:9278 length:1122 start_codon:yes stop_codon:yes gene_type:complete